MKPRVAVMFGGKSVEHEVSIISGIQACSAIDTDSYSVVPVYISKSNKMYVGQSIGDIEAYKDIDGLIERSQRVILVQDDGEAKLVSYPLKRFGKSEDIVIDVVLPVVHGTNMEDGAFQGYLKTIGVPFGGCDVTASALGMDKYISKVLFKECGIPVLDALRFSVADYGDVDGIVARSEDEIGYPMIVKPANLGSSVGIGVARNRAELVAAIDDAFLYATQVVVEHAILNLREINCSVLGDESEAIASECEEPLHTVDILSYEDKYVNGSKKSGSKGMASVSRIIPAKLSPERREEIRQMAVRAFQTLGCSGVARIDFMIDADTDKLYLNEINTIPGSLAFYLWEPVGISYSELLDRLIKLALKRARAQESLTFSFDTNILDSASMAGAKGSKR
jgi:D-alanine-D-alanine ligase